MPPLRKRVSRKDRIIAVIGPVGSGKSTFIKTATQGNGTSIGHGLHAYTKDIQAIRYIHPVDHCPVVFVDTPGFDELYTPATDVLSRLAEWLVKTYKGNVDLAAIVYLHRITDNRMAGSLMKSFQTFVSLCGQEAMPNIILATTMWDEVRENIGNRREKELKEIYWRDMLKDGCLLARFDDTYESAWGVVGNLAGEDGGQAQLPSSRWSFCRKIFGILIRPGYP